METIAQCAYKLDTRVASCRARAREIEISFVHFEFKRQILVSLKFLFSSIQFELLELRDVENANLNKPN